VRASCARGSVVAVAGTIGGPTLIRQRPRVARSAALAGPNQAMSGDPAPSSAVSRRTSAWPAPHACEAAATNKRKKRKHKRPPERRRRQESFKIVPLECLQYTTPARELWRLSCMVGVCECSCWDSASGTFSRNCPGVRGHASCLRQFSSNQRDQSFGDRALRGDSRRARLHVRSERRHGIGVNHCRT
jgi:hypothetical protein